VLGCRAAFVAAAEDDTLANLAIVADWEKNLTESERSS